MKRAASRRKLQELTAGCRMLPADEGRLWRLDALCRSLDPELFFPVSVEDAETPLRVCRECPVRLQCFRERQRWGIWGGTTEWERSDFARWAAARGVCTV
jgi:WhiB family redox-sensing transcriptional regulator